MPSSCKDIRQELIECLLQSDCVLRQRHSVKECLQDEQLRNTLPERCLTIRKSYYECRRGILDMRTRFRGNGSR
ncbi:cytochrome c oxidase assembly factor 5-like protein [Syncephalis pseudoplumigaleata]|uniref:Cytochrome c oxidase assembly factor 5-like protein n=1 Tax=Syncephalis pseudoplumigaleata TaxID=1712513 RepID=A0A4P9YSD3_9FUNG|nr:cytochrome c oxidase assembly factor 5-like protein [Syncephalis pseudoplumigaleata]|eukprot:RKP22615.1 cytochrome c oxidase assembly factor 5-like protein [Syncephalis pseudoplumigaleata]